MKPHEHIVVQIALYILFVIIDLIYIKIISDSGSPKTKKAPWVYVYKTAFILSFIPGPNALIALIVIIDLIVSFVQAFVVFLKEYWTNLHTEKSFRRYT